MKIERGFRQTAAENASECEKYCPLRENYGSRFINLSKEAAIGQFY